MLHRNRLRGLDVGACGLAGGFGVAGGDGVEQCVHFGWGAGASATAGDGDQAQSVDAGVEGFGNAPGHGVACAVKHGFVKGGGFLDDAGVVLAVEGGFDVAQVGLHFFNVLRRGAGGAASGGVAFEQGAQFVDLARGVGVQGGHNGALLGDGLDQAFGFQVAQHFPNHGAAYAEFFAEVAFDQALAGFEVLVEDGIANFVEREFAQSFKAAFYFDIDFGRHWRPSLGLYRLKIGVHYVGLAG